MTGLEVIAAIFIIGALTGAATGTKDSATKTEVCLICMTTETSNETDVDAVTPPNLHEDTPQ